MKGKVQYIDGEERGRGRGEGNQRWMGGRDGRDNKVVGAKVFFFNENFVNASYGCRPPL